MPFGDLRLMSRQSEPGRDGSAHSWNIRAEQLRKLRKLAEHQGDPDMHEAAARLEQVASDTADAGDHARSQESPEGR